MSQYRAKLIIVVQEKSTEQPARKTLRRHDSSQKRKYTGHKHKTVCKITLFTTERQIKTTYQMGTSAKCDIDMYP